jgi:hypothetical protein
MLNGRRLMTEYCELAWTGVVADRDEAIRI